MQGHNGYDAKEERNKNSLGTLEQQFRPGSFTDGKIYAHTGNIEQERDSPDIQHGHRLPQTFHDLITPDKSYKHGPGLENDSNMIDYKQTYGNHAQPVNIVSSFDCHHIT